MADFGQGRLFAGVRLHVPPVDAKSGIRTGYSLPARRWRARDRGDRAKVNKISLLPARVFVAGGGLAALAELPCFMAGAMKKAGYAVVSFKSEKGERTYRINS
jgi:hypothetical protein